SGDTVPFVLTGLVPEALFATPPVNPIAGRGVQPGLIGKREFLRFPLQTYFQTRVAFVDEPYNFPQGEVNLKTGRVIGEMEYPSYYAQALADSLFAANEPRISKDPFFVVAERPVADGPETMYALFEKGVNGETVFRYSGQHRRSFATFLFPA